MHDYMSVLKLKLLWFGKKFPKKAKETFEISYAEQKRRGRPEERGKQDPCFWALVWRDFEGRLRPKRLISMFIFCYLTAKRTKGLGH